MAENAIPTFHSKAKADAERAAEAARQMSNDADQFLAALDALLSDTIPG